MNWETYSILQLKSNLLFNCIVAIFKDGISVWDTYEVSELLGIEEKQVKELFEILEEQKIIEEDESGEYSLVYDSLKSILKTHENAELLNYLNSQYDAFQENVLYLKEQFEDDTVISDDKEEDGYDEELEDLKYETERELEKTKKLNRELEKEREKEKEKQRQIKRDAEKEYVFTSSRIAGQDFFPEKITITNGIITWSKGHILSKKETSFQISKVSSVSISSGVIYVDIEIKSSNGKIAATNFTKGDAREIKRLIENGI